MGAHGQANWHPDGCLAALAQALRPCPPGPRTGLVPPSDRGTPYCADAYQAQVRAAGLVCPMTEGSGDCYQDCYQNALAERLNGILQDEFLVPQHLPPARRLVAQAVHLYKNERPHQALHYRTPNQVHPQAKSPTGKSGQGSCLFSVNV